MLDLSLKIVFRSTSILVIGDRSKVGPSAPAGAALYLAVLLPQPNCKVEFKAFNDFILIKFILKICISFKMLVINVEDEFSSFSTVYHTHYERSTVHYKLIYI